MPRTINNLDHTNMRVPTKTRVTVEWLQRELGADSMMEVLDLVTDWICEPEPYRAFKAFAVAKKEAEQMAVARRTESIHANLRRVAEATR